MSRLMSVFVVAVLAIVVGVYGTYLLDWAKMGLGTAPSSSEPQLLAPNPQSPTLEETMAETRRIVVGGLRCQLGDAEPSECGDVCKNVAKSSDPVDLDAGAGSHQVVEELCRCLKEAGVEVRMVSQSRCPRPSS